MYAIEQLEGYATIFSMYCYSFMFILRKRDVVFMRRNIRLIGVVLILLILLVVLFIPRTQTYAKGGGGWSAYMGSNARTGFNASETIITPATAPHLKQRWTHQAAGVVATQPITANGNVYWGSGDGLEHATNIATGKDVWTANLGTSTDTCTHVVHGVLSSAAVATVSIAGSLTSVVFVGGGNVQLYALNAVTGAVIWHTPLGTQPSYFLYGSPAVYHGSVYIGLSSNGDCPLIQGAFLQLNASTGTLQHSFAVVPSGCIGGSIWVAPAIDAATNMLYVATGNEGTCSATETMTDALVELRAKDLSLVASWQVPVAEQILDGDFGSTPMLFQATISGTVHHMVGLVNKNGIYYALDRTNISAGPLWEERMAAAPINGTEDNIASSAWDKTTLYEAGGSATINGMTCAGHLRAVNPANGAFLWQDCLASDVFGPVTAVPGLLEVGCGSSLLLIAATTGQQLFAFQDTATKSFFQGPGTISNGILYHGNKDGLLYAFGT